MRLVLSTIVIAFSWFGAFAPDASAQASDAKPATNPAWVADTNTIANIRAIVANTKGADVAFAVGDDGNIRHIQSGMICPPKFPNVVFRHAQIYSSIMGVGMDVGCDYGRDNRDGVVASKLTIFATKAKDGWTLDGTFLGYRNEVLKTYPDAVSQGEALKIEDKSGNAFPPIRSEEFIFHVDGFEYTSDLLVAIKNGWILEIRASFLGKPGEVNMGNGATVDDAVLEIGDRAMLSQAFIRAAATIGSQP